MEGIIKRYNMLPHPEGGYFVQWYASEDKISTDLNERYPKGSSRACSTAILYMCHVGGKSALHKIKGDEMWMWHSGAPLTVVELFHGEGEADATVRKTILGADVAHGQTFVHTVTAGTYFGAYVEPQESSSSADYSLVTCVVSPGFHYDDWSMETAAVLLQAYPGEAAKIEIDRLASS